MGSVQRKVTLGVHIRGGTSIVHPGSTALSDRPSLLDRRIAPVFFHSEMDVMPTC